MPPETVEVLETLSVYNSALDKWYKALWNIFYQQETSKYKPIDINSVGNSTVISGTSGKRILIHSIWFTVAGATNITFYDGTSKISGAMDFGDTSEPRGMVASQLIKPIELGEGNSFIINLAAAVQVSGTVIYSLL